jgi:hypothetical protein
MDRQRSGAGHGGDDQSESQKPQCYFPHDENLLMNPVPDIGTWARISKDMPERPDESSGLKLSIRKVI